MTLALAPELKCACGGAIDPTEEGRCAHCRMIERGDDQLLTHDSRGWMTGTRRVRYGRHKAPSQREPPTSTSWQKATEGHPGHARVAAVFGSWSAGLEAAGFDGRRRAPGSWQERGGADV